MTVGRWLLLAIALLAGAPSAAAPAEDAPVVLARVEPMPRAAAAGDRRCTRDGRHCIARASYMPDVCRTIEATARESGIDVGFFARLVWRESLFDAAAVSPAGALGIAQFIPETAERRGLADPFNPAEALAASAGYLADLARAFGNIGLAAAAYNGGEARVERYLAGDGGLPAETRAYVEAITGHPVETWRGRPPASLDLALDGATPFQAACVAQAAGRSFAAFRSTPPLLPWGVVVASNRDSAGAERQVARLKHRHAAVLGGEAVSYSRGRRPGMPGKLYFAQVGRGTRAEADALCGRLRAAGGDCMVLRNDRGSG
jgi:hypothetical protein